MAEYAPPQSLTDIVAALVADKNVAVPPHFNSPGLPGQIAVADSGSPPNPAFYICLNTNFWLQVTSAGVFSTTF
jgi:hypothetical protein